MFQSVIQRAERSTADLTLELAVVVPVLNEAANIEILIARIDDLLSGIGWEVVFVDDHSPDGTSDIVRAIAKSDRRVRIVERIGRRGLSSAVVEGTLATAAPVIIVMDGDLQHDEGILPALFAAVQGGADIAIGSRYVVGGSVGAWSAERVTFSRVATRLASFVLPVRVTDPMSGFFAMRRSVFEAAQPKLSATGFKFLLDLLISAPVAPTIVEIPYGFRVRKAGESKLDFMVAIEYVELLIDKSIGRFVPIRLLKFMAVGLMGLLVHLSVLWSALSLGGDFGTAQTCAVVVAMTFNFALNNVFTYRDKRLRGWAMVRGLVSFYAVCLVGAAANIGIGTLAHGMHQSWWLAGIAGALIGSVWNFAASSIFTWRR
jgi:dolichol-phosphate mannosyltransferase